MKPIITTENLNVIYDIGKSAEAKALQNASVEIYPGEYIIFFGPSGCGKSTLLYSIAGLQRPTSGKVIIGEQDITNLSPDKLVEFHRKEVGMVFQAYYLIPSLTVLDNVILPQIFESIGVKKRVLKGKELLKKFGIILQEKRLSTELSGGQQQRVAICRALINDPLILLADEPVGNLDSNSATTVMNLLSNLNEKEKRTIILVTHDPSYLSYAHRVIHMKDGKITKEVVNKEKGQIKPVAKTGGISTQFDQLSQLYPYMSNSELQAKALTNWLTVSIDTKEILRLEKTIARFMANEISENEFFEILDKPYENGGIGLYKQKAIEFTRKIKKLVNETSCLKVEENENRGVGVKTEKEIFSSKITEIRKYLLDGYEGQVTHLQVERMDDLIGRRLNNEINRWQVQRGFDISVSQKGVGLNKRTAKNLAKKLELILMTL